MLEKCVPWKKLREIRLQVCGQLEFYLFQCCKFTDIFLTWFHCSYGEKNTKMLGIVHERTKVNDSFLNEYGSAISHTKESNTSNFSVPDEIDPKVVYSLLKRMLDEVLSLL